MRGFLRERQVAFIYNRIKAELLTVLPILVASELLIFRQICRLYVDYM